MGYLDDHVGVIPVAGFGVLHSLVLVEDLHGGRPVGSAVHKVVLGEVEREAQYRGLIEHRVVGLIVLLVVRELVIGLVDIVAQVGQVQVIPVLAIRLGCP